VIGFRLIEEAHTGTNIAERISDVVEAFGMTDKIFAVSLDNASSNNNAMQILAPILARHAGTRSWRRMAPARQRQRRQQGKKGRRNAAGIGRLLLACMQFLV